MTLVRSLGVQWLATVYVAGFSILLTFFLGRLFGPETFGKYSYIVTLASLFAILQDGGFRTLLFREIASPSLRLKTEKLFPLALGHTMTVTVLGLLIVALFPFQDPITLMLSIVVFSLGTIANFISAGLKGQGEFQREAWWRVIVRSLTGMGVFACIFLFSPRVEWVFTGWIAGILLSLVLQKAYSLREFQIPRPNPQIYRSIAALVTIDIATLIYFKIDIVMLRHIGGALHQVGFYAAACRILEGIIFIFFPFANVLFRNLRLIADQPARFIRLTNKLILLSGLASAVIVPLGMIFGDDIVVLCFGSRFEPGADVMYWLSVALVFMIPNLVLTQGSLAINQENHYAVGACLSALLNVGLNFYLIPLYGAKGAAMGTVFTEAFLLLFIGAGIYSWFLRRRTPRHES